MSQLTVSLSPHARDGCTTRRIMLDVLIALLPCLVCGVVYFGLYALLLVVICMAAYFVSIAKAPVTGVIMTVELTWNFMFLLPVILGVAAGYLIGDVFRTKPVYERLLDEMLGDEPPQRFTARFAVEKEGLAAGRRVCDVLWPADVRLVRLERGEERILPDGNTQLLEGDILTAEGETGEDTIAVLEAAVGPRLE